MRLLQEKDARLTEEWSINSWLTEASSWERKSQHLTFKHTSFWAPLLVLLASIASSHSGICRAITAGLVLKYWLKRSTAYPRKSKSMEEYLAWMRAQKPQKK